MRKRNVHIQLWLDEKEADRFNTLVNRSGLPREVYLRHLINSVIPTDAPPPDYFSMMTQIRRVGVNLNQIAKKAHTLNMVDAARYDECVTMLKSSILEITNAVMLPRKMERKIE